MGEGGREVQFGVYADVSDTTAHVEHDAPSAFQVDRYIVDEEILAETGFDEGRISYNQYSTQLHSDRMFLASYDVEPPEIYGLAETFVESYPLVAIDTDVLQQRYRRRLRRKLERRIDEDMGQQTYNAAVADALDTVDLGAAIDFDAFRDRVTIEISTVYNVPIKEG